MTTKDQALKLALEALEFFYLYAEGRNEEKMADKAITAIREALEQPAQQEPEQSEIFCGVDFADGLLSVSVLRRRADDVAELLHLEQIALPAQQQEPVAYMGTDIDGNPNKFRLNPFGGCVPLYEKPQSVKVWDAEGYDALCQQLEGWKAKANKPWVGLTDEEIKKMHNDLCNTVGSDFKTVARATETKLREKNAQPSKPLTDEQIAAAMTGYGPTGVGFPALRRVARAIEAAHGITGESK